MSSYIQKALLKQHWILVADYVFLQWADSENSAKQQGESPPQKTSLPRCSPALHFGFWIAASRALKDVFPALLFSKGNVKRTYTSRRNISKLKYYVMGNCGSLPWFPILLQDIHSLFYQLGYSTMAHKWQNGKFWSLQLFLNCYISPYILKMMSRCAWHLPLWPYKTFGKYRQKGKFDDIYTTWHIV